MHLQGPSAVDIVCDSTCLGAMKLKAGMHVTVEDLWSNSSTSIVLEDSYTVKSVAPQGGVTMLKISA